MRCMLLTCCHTDEEPYNPYLLGFAARQMCCELEECFLVVFNTVEAVCYMKAEAALAGEHFRTEDAAAGRDVYLIDSRSGE